MKSVHYVKLVRLGTALELSYYMVIVISKEDITILIYKFHVQGGGEEVYQFEINLLELWNIKSCIFFHYVLAFHVSCVETAFWEFIFKMQKWEIICYR